MHVQKVFFQGRGIVHDCLRVSQGGAATLYREARHETFGKAWVSGREVRPLQCVLMLGWAKGEGFGLIFKKVALKIFEL
jgi:hypothetical protein